MASEVSARWGKGGPIGPETITDKPMSAPRSETNASLLRAARGGNVEKVLELLDSGAASIEACNPNGLNALHLAAKEGHVHIVSVLLARQSAVDAASKKGNTALHIASLAGHEEIIKLLVQAGARINVQSQSGFTPLYMAAQENHAEVVKFLLDHGANQGLATEDGFTALSVALQQGHNKVVAILMENDSRNKVRLPALHVAAKKDDVRAATLLLQPENDGSGKKAVSVNDATKSGFTPLHIAAHYGSLNVAKVLLSSGADVESRARNAITPLHVASKWGRTTVVSLLTSASANLECKTRDSLTPLHCASRSGHDQCVDVMLEKGANISAKTKNGLTALHMAAQGDHVDCARILLFHHAQIDDVTMDYLTPLHVAAHCGNVKVAKLLLDNQCEVNARALNGFTPLHVACKKNRIKVIELLLRYGALVESTTESGLTPLHVASFMGHITVVNYLLENGAQTETQTVRGETALHLAARANQTEIMRILLRNGAQVDARAKELQTPLHISSRLGNVDGVQLLLQHGAARDATTKDLYTPLHIAVKEGHEDVVQILLDNGAKQDIATKKGFTPLHIAAKYGNVPIAKILLSKNAQPNIEGKNGLTPLHVATHYNNPDVALLLLEHGASPHAAAKNGYTPLHIAAKKDQVDIAKLLLDHGAKPNAESKNGYTPLHLASQEGHTEVVELLLNRKADVNCKARNGLTPMHLAAQEDQVPVAEILVAHGSLIDPQTKAGYTPLHTACHFGQLAMIRFLLEHGASVGAVTKLGYTPLHQAAQQGHVLVINLLLKYKADPNAVSTTDQTPLSIAQRLGYISVVEILKHITEKEVPIDDTDTKYKVVFPETMQEAPIDSDDEGGDGTLMADRSYHYLTVDDAKDMRYNASSPTEAKADPRGADLFAFETVSGRQSTLSSVGARDPLLEELRYMRANTEEVEPQSSRYGSITPSSHRDGPGYPSSSHDDYYDGRAVTPGPAEDDAQYIWRDDTRLSDFMSPSAQSYAQRDEDGRYLNGPPLSENRVPGRALSEQSGPDDEDPMVVQRVGQQYGSIPTGTSYHQDTQATLVRPGSKNDVDSRMYGSMYSDTSIASTFNPDNVSIDRHPITSGFLVSFMVDARGGAMKGCRHSGVRLLVPPGKVCQPTRLTCKLIRREKLSNPPPLMEAEALATRVLQMGPAGTKFNGSVLIEVPHYASLHGQEREIVILRSETGATWHEHSTQPTSEDIQKALGAGFHGEDFEAAEELYHGRVARILTSDFPRYFAVVTRIRQETKHVGPERTIISSTVAPQVQVLIPPKAVTKPIKVGLQAHPVPLDVLARASNEDQRVSVSPIVTIEPRHRKFHEPITVTIPLPANSTLRGKGKSKQGKNSGNEAAGLRLLCSISGGTAPSSWEDLTGTIPLTLVDDCVSFATNVSARFWLIEVPPAAASTGEPQRIAREIWHEVVAVPMMSKFVVFAKRRTMAEARLRMFCMTDDNMEKTLESQQRFVEIARSKDVEVLDGRPQYIELAGNISPKASDQASMGFRAFRENRTALTVRLKDIKAEPSGQLIFLPLARLPDVRPAQPSCVLNVTLPETNASASGAGMLNGVGGLSSDSGGETDHVEMLAALDAAHHTSMPPVREEGISKAELRLTDIADALGSDWVPLARHFGMSQPEIVGIQKEYSYAGEQALVVLHKWIERNEELATGNELERALQRIGRGDIVDKCMRNLEPVVDDLERKDALSQIEADSEPLIKKTSHLNTAAPVVPATQPSDQSQSSLGPVEQEVVDPDHVSDERSPLFDDPSIKVESKPEKSITDSEGTGSRDRRSTSREKEENGISPLMQDSEPSTYEEEVEQTQQQYATSEPPLFSQDSKPVSQDAEPVAYPLDEPYETEVGGVEEEDEGPEGTSDVRVYRDVYEEPPVVETDVQEFEETLPDGSTVTRTVTTTKQKQVVMHRVTMEGPEESLESSTAKEVLLREAGVEEEGEENDDQTDVQEYEQTLPDGSVVTGRITKKTHTKTVVKYDDDEDGTPL